MRIEQRRLADGLWSVDASPGLGGAADLVLAVGTAQALGSPDVFGDLRRAYPHARLVSCSRPRTDDDDDELSAVAVSFERCTAQVVLRQVAPHTTGADISRDLGLALAHEDLRHVFVFGGSAGLEGAAVASGLATALPPSVSIVGGLLAGRVGLDAPPDVPAVVAVGLRGARLDLDVVVEAGDALAPGEGRVALSRRPPAVGSRFALLMAGPQDDGGEARSALADLARDSLGARAALLHLPVRTAIGRCDRMALPLSLPRGLALAAVGEARGQQEP